MVPDSITLKWGTLKGWQLASEKCRDIVQRYLDLGSSYSVMAQSDSDEQKNIICELIDAVDGEIWNDWDNVIMSKDAAKKYVLEYRRRR